MRDGLEDILLLGKGQLAETNTAGALKLRQFIEGLVHAIATPDEAGEIPSRKCGDLVAF